MPPEPSPARPWAPVDNQLIYIIFFCKPDDVPGPTAGDFMARMRRRTKDRMTMAAIYPARRRGADRGSNVEARGKRWCLKITLQ